MPVHVLQTSDLHILPFGEGEVVSDREVLGGMPVIAGTRVPAETVAAYLRAGCSEAYIRDDYPTLPADALQAVEAWAVRTHGLDWRTASNLG